jgi:hypothetical protein
MSQIRTKEKCEKDANGNFGKKFHFLKMKIHKAVLCLLPLDFSELCCMKVAFATTAILLL